MDRAWLEGLQFVVILGTIELERIDPSSAFLGIEPALGEEHAHRVDPVLDPVHGRYRDVLQPKAFQNFQAAFARSQLFSLGVMGDNMASVHVGPPDDLSNIMAKVHT